MSTIVIIGNIIKEINKGETQYTGGVINATLSALVSSSKVKIVTNLQKEDSEIAFKKLKDLGAEIITKNNLKTTTIVDGRVTEVGNTIETTSIKNVNGDYYYFVPSLNSDINTESIKELSKSNKIALSIRGFMNFIKDEKINIERFQELHSLLEYVSFLTIDKDLCFIQEFTNDEDQVAKTYAKKGCKEILIPYHEALFNYRDNFFYRCKYVSKYLHNRDKITDIALAAYVSKIDELIKEEALFYATALCCFYMEDIDISNLTNDKLTAKMIDIGIV